MAVVGHTTAGEQPRLYVYGVVYIPRTQWITNPPPPLPSWPKVEFYGPGFLRHAMMDFNLDQCMKKSHVIQGICKSGAMLALAMDHQCWATAAARIHILSQGIAKLLFTLA